MKLKLFFVLFCFACTSMLFAQDAEQPLADAPAAEGQQANKQSNANQQDVNMKRLEDLVNSQIFDLSTSLKSFSALLKTRIRVLPYRVVFYKGKANANGDQCDISDDQRLADVDCLRAEIFDFTYATTKGQSAKTRYKFIELYFNKEEIQQNITQTDPRYQQPITLDKIITRAYTNNLSKDTIVISEIIDNAPNSQPAHDDQIFCYYQRDGFPDYYRQESPDSKGEGMFSLATVQNDRTFNFRTELKKDFYLANLVYFERLLRKIRDFNSGVVSQKYVDNLRNLENSLDF